MYICITVDELKQWIGIADGVLGGCIYHSSIDSPILFSNFSEQQCCWTPCINTYTVFYTINLTLPQLTSFSSLL